MYKFIHIIYKKLYIFALLKNVHKIILCKNTINMPIKEIKMKPREIQTLSRFENSVKSSVLLKDFFNKGFNSFIALRAIVSNYYPEITERELFDFWNLRKFDEELYLKLGNVFEKLKSE
jgi:hypothetical protein